jgi:nifR3 family TIM-barrel protein
MTTAPFAPPTPPLHAPHLRACYRDSQLRHRWALATPAFLAPMEGLTSEPIRRCFSRVGGIGVVCTEFVRVHNGTAFGDVKGARDAWLAAEIAQGKLPTSKLSVQFMGDDPVKLGYAAQIAEEAGADFVDLNLGCPPKSGGRTCAGSTMLKDDNFPIALNVIRAMSAAVRRIPFTVKLRLGWSDPNDLIRLTQAIQDAGASMVTIHGRTAEQKYSGKADWDRIGQAKARLTIPVLVNGDITTIADAEDALARSGADGVMIGRGALRNPWLFRQLQETAEGRTPVVPTPEMVMAFMRDMAEDWSVLAKPPGNPNFMLAKLKNVLNFWDAVAFDQLKRTTSLDEFYARLEAYLHATADGSRTP